MNYAKYIFAGLAIAFMGVGIFFFSLYYQEAYPTQITQVRYAFADATASTSPSTSAITTTTCSDNMNFGVAGGTELQADDTTTFSYTAGNWDAGDVSDGVYASNFGFTTSGTIDESGGR